eukprot:7595573-Pyramimonas_sp.AAC.2
MGRLELVAEADSSPALRGTLFPVFKDAKVQRAVRLRSAELPLRRLPGLRLRPLDGSHHRRGPPAPAEALRGLRRAGQ